MFNEPVTPPESDEARDAERKAALDRIGKEAFESGLYDRTGMPEDGEDA